MDIIQPALPVDNPHAEDQVQYLLRLQEAARDAINDAQVQRRNVDKKRIAATLIKEGHWVLLRRKESEKRKLAPIADGPFQVTKSERARPHSDSPPVLVRTLLSTFPGYSYTLDRNRNS
jgi:hypothetical protein